MKRYCLLIILCVVAIFSSLAFAQKPGGYVRKTLKPDFFIPEGELDKKEKLPTFYYKNADSLYPKKHDVVDRNGEIVSSIDDATIVETFDASKVEPNKYIDFKNAGLGGAPLYKRKYKDYVNDLNVFAKTGKMPYNKELEDDLAKMNSNLRFLVE